MFSFKSFMDNYKQNAKPNTPPSGHLIEPNLPNQLKFEPNLNIARKTSIGILH